MHINFFPSGLRHLFKSTLKSGTLPYTVCGWQLTMSSIFRILLTVSEASRIADVETNRGWRTFSSKMSVIVPCVGSACGDYYDTNLFFTIIILHTCVKRYINDCAVVTIESDICLGSIIYWKRKFYSAEKFQIGHVAVRLAQTLVHTCTSWQIMWLA